MSLRFLIVCFCFILLGCDNKKDENYIVECSIIENGYSTADMISSMNNYIACLDGNIRKILDRNMNNPDENWKKHNEVFNYIYNGNELTRVVEFPGEYPFSSFFAIMEVGHMSGYLNAMIDFYKNICSKEEYMNVWKKLGKFRNTEEYYRINSKCEEKTGVSLGEKEINLEKINKLNNCLENEHIAWTKKNLLDDDYVKNKKINVKKEYENLRELLIGEKGLYIEAAKNCKKNNEKSELKSAIYYCDFLIDRLYSASEPVYQEKFLK